MCHKTKVYQFSILSMETIKSIYVVKMLSLLGLSLNLKTSTEFSAMEKY